jgi:hypothetical protein
MMFVALLLVVIGLWGARESRMEALRQRGIARRAGADVSAANRALAMRLAGIALTVVCGVIAIALLSEFLP